MKHGNTQLGLGLILDQYQLSFFVSTRDFLLLLFTFRLHDRHKHGRCSQQVACILRKLYCLLPITLLPEYMLVRRLTKDKCCSVTCTNPNSRERRGKRGNWLPLDSDITVSYRSQISFFVPFCLDDKGRPRVWCTPSRGWITYGTGFAIPVAWNLRVSSASFQGSKSPSTASGFPLCADFTLLC